MRDLELFRVYGLKRVLSISYPALRRILCVYNRVLYETKNFRLGLFRHIERTAQFVNLLYLFIQSE